MRTTFKLFIAAGALAVAAPMGLLGTTAAHAATAPTPTPCSQSTCDGLDPTLSYEQETSPPAFCNAGAQDVSDLPNGEAALGGLLELRWGPNCQTNWTRFTPGNNDKYEIWVTSLSNGVWAGTGLYTPYIFSDANGVPNYSDQVYSPGPAAACVRDITTNSADICFNQ
jgi:hypothetical protein